MYSRESVAAQNHIKMELSACLILRIIDTDGFRGFTFRSFGIGVEENILIEE
jgi:hypothetical protein